MAHKYRIAFFQDDNSYALTADRTLIQSELTLEQAERLLSWLDGVAGERPEKPKPARAPRVQFNLEALWQLYPRKEGKKDAMRALSPLIRSSDDFELMRQAVERFAIHCRRNLVDPKFIKHMAGWLRAERYKEFLGEPTEKAQPTRIDVSALPVESID